MEWISVEEQLPEPNKRVLFLWRGRLHCVGRYVGEDGSCEWLDDLDCDRYGEPTSTSETTHWMPLPPPPAMPTKDEM